MKIDLEALEKRLRRPSQLVERMKEYAAASEQLADLFRTDAMSEATKVLAKLVRGSTDPKAGEALMAVGIMQWNVGAVITTGALLQQEAATELLNQIEGGEIRRRFETSRDRQRERAHSRQQSRRARLPRPRRWGPARWLCEAVFTSRPDLRTSEFDAFLSAIGADDGHLWGNNVRAERRAGATWLIELLDREAVVSESELRRKWREVRKSDR